MACHCVTNLCICLVSATFVSRPACAADTIRITFGRADNIGRIWEGSVHVSGGELQRAEGWLLGEGEFVRPDGSFRLASPAPDPAVRRPGRPNARVATFFWAKDTSGPYQGYGVPRRIDFDVPGGKEFQVIRLRPEWAEDREVIKIRFDPPPYAAWEIDAFRILEPPVGGGDSTVIRAWEFDRPGHLEGWIANLAISDFETRGGALCGESSGQHPLLQNISTFPVTGGTYVEIAIRWTALKDAPVQEPALHRGLLLRTGGASWRIEAATNQGDLALSAGELRAGVPLDRLGGAARVELVPDAALLSDETAQDDYPSLAVGPDGTAYCAWVSHRDGADRVLLARHSAGQWSAPEQVNEKPGDIFRAKVAVDGSGRLWVVWSEQRNGCWHLWARSWRAGKWSQTARLTEGRGPSILHELAAAPSGDLWLAWQSGEAGNFDIHLKEYNGRKWVRSVQVTSGPANEWEPSLAVDSRGRVHVVWDTYRHGNYDVYGATWEDGELSEPFPVATSPKFEAHATVACDKQDRLWIAWDEGDERWGKDWGMKMDDPFGAPLHASRRLRLAVLGPDGLREAATDPYSVIPEEEQVFCEHPLLQVDSGGRLWLMYRYLVARAEVAERALVLVGAAWGVGALSVEGDTWRRIAYFPHSEGRDDESLMALAPGPEAMWFAWSMDGRPRGTSNVGNNQVYAGPLRLPPGEGEDLAVGQLVEAQPARVARRSATVATTFRDRELMLLWGDLHRHTEISGDGHKDGTLFEAYRYCMDAAEMDFLAVTDHGAGGDREYSWWRTQQSADLFRAPGLFTPIYGYERSEQYPNGHRNVFQATRGVRTVPTFKGPDGKIAEDDTKRLYETLRRDGGIAISHTIATDQGTDWRDNDSELEPVLELFQGLRNESYEYTDAPRGITRDSRPAQTWGYQPAGFAWRAWEKGLRLGVICASDHISTHISYAGVYAPSRSREDILDAIKDRHTFGSTDRIVLDLRATTSGGQAEWFMGDDFSARGTPRLNVRVAATGEIRQVDIVRDNAFVYTSDPDGSEVELEYQDQEATAGEHYYYVRVIQEDGEMAWSSPIWIALAAT
jgi:hypothetical protein